MKYNTAAVLAGGRSSRFGKDKALTPFGDKTLIEHICCNLTPLFDELFIISDDREKFEGAGAVVIPDLFRESGPLGGIHAALKAGGKGYVFITACDMPYISQELIIRMQSEIHRTEPSAVVTGRDGFIEPFHAYYSTALISEIEDALLTSSCGLFAFLKKVSPVVLKTTDHRPFININSPEDLQKITFPIR